MIDFLWLIPVFFVAYLFGRFIGKNRPTEQTTPQVRTYEFEVVDMDSMYFAYDLATGLFLGQNADLHELALIVKDAKPGYQIYAALTKDKQDDTV